MDTERRKALIFFLSGSLCREPGRGGESGRNLTFADPVRDLDPLSVAEAETKELTPSMGRIRFLMHRWSCSTLLLRHLILTILIGNGQPKDFGMRFIVLIPAVSAPVDHNRPRQAIRLQSAGEEPGCGRLAGPL